MIKRGRPKIINEWEPKIKYSVLYEDKNGDKTVWYYNKEINNNGPISVEFISPQFNTSEKLLRELEKLEQKYQPKKGDRKPRITKADKQRMEQIQNELEEFHYSIYPDDRPATRGRKPKK